MYLRAAKTEAEEAGEETDGMANSISELRGEILALTGNKVDIQVEGKDEFKSTYQILKELSEVWDSLSDISQANILEMVGGKRNANVVAAIIENFDIAEDALATSLQSEGSALDEHAKAMDSVEGRINTLKSSFANLSETLLDAEDIKTLLSSVTAVVDAFTAMSKAMNSIGGIKTELIATLGIFATFKADEIVGTLVDGFGLLKKHMSDLPIAHFVKGFNEARKSGESMTNSFRSGFSSVAASASTATIAFSSITAILTVLIAAYSAYNQAREESIRKSSEEAAKAAELVDSARALSASYSEYAEYASMTERTVEQEGAMNNALQTVIDSIGEKAAVLNGLTQGTKEYEEALKGVVAAEMESAHTNAIIEEHSAREALVTKGSDIWGSNLELYYGSTGKNVSREVELVESIMGRGFLSQRSQVHNQNAPIDGSAMAFYTTVDTKNAKEVVLYYQKLLSLKDALADEGLLDNSIIYKDLQNLIAEFSAEVEAYQKSVYDLASSNYKESIGVPETQDQKESYYRHMVRYMQIAYKVSSDVARSMIDAEMAAEGMSDVIGSMSRTKIDLFGGDANGDIYADRMITNAQRIGDSLAAFIDTEDFKSASGELQDIVNSVGNLDASKIEELAQESESLAAILESDGMNARFLAKIISTELSGGDGLALITDGALELNKALDGMRSRFDEVTEAKRRYDEAMSIEEKDSNFKSIAEAFKALNEEFVAGTTNSNAFWAAAEYIFGEEQLSAWGWEDGLQQIYDAMSANVGVFEDAESAGFGFINRFLDIADGGRILDEYGRKVAEIKELSDGSFDIDIDGEAISLIAEKMQLSEEAVLSCIEALDMWGDIDFHNIDEIIARAGELNLVMYRNNGKDKIINMDGLDEQLRNLGLTAKEINDIKEELRQLDSVTLIGAEMQVEDLIESLESLGVIMSDEFGVEVDFDALTSLFEELGFTEEQAKDTIKKLSEMNNLRFSSLKGELGSVDDAMGRVEDLDLSSVRGEVDRTTSSVDNLATSLSKINGKKYTFTVQQQLLGWTINDNNNPFNPPANTNGKFDGLWTAGADGIKSAKGGIALTGEEGEELVQSGSTARLVGTNGPEFTYLKPGDRVYTAEETKKIKKSLGKVSGRVPAFAGGGVYGGISEKKWNSLLGDTGGSSNNSGNGSNNSSSNSTSNSNKENDESEFDRLYKYHQHLLEMDKESVRDYLDWLDGAYKDAYQKGEIDLDEYRQYCEEVYQGLQDLFRDYLNDTEHEISMRGEYDGETSKIISLYEEMISAIEKEIASAREYGLDNSNDYVQELQEKYAEYKQAIVDIQDELKDNAKSSVEELVDIRIKMLKKDVEADKDAIKEKLDNLKEFYDKQKEMLREFHDEEKYLEDQSDRRKDVSDVQASIDQLKYDDSAWAEKRRLELQQELSDAQKALDDLEKDHALELTEKKLDEMYELQKKDLDAQTEALQKKVEDAKSMYVIALEDIRSGSVALYEEMVAWNQSYGDGIDETIKTAWEGAYVALKKYHDLFGSHYEGIALPNATGHVFTVGSWEDAAISGYASGTSNATAGIHRVNEDGDEYIFKSSDGSSYRVFSGGEKVLTAGATDFLYSFANSKGAILTDFMSKLFDKSILGKICPSVQQNQINMGDIIVQGNADNKTVSEIRRAQRESLTDVLRGLNKLSK